MYIYSFLLRMTDTVTSQNIDIFSWDTLYIYIYICIQGVSRLEDITAGGDFLGVCDQKSSYKYVSDFGRLRSYGHF